MHSLFLVSDRTGITVELLGKSLFSQFGDATCEWISMPFMDSEAKIRKLVSLINESASEDCQKPIVLSTIVDELLRNELKAANAHVLDLYEIYLPQIAGFLGQTPVGAVGQVHGMSDAVQYQSRIDALDHALKFDDGARVSQLELTDIILIGVSRVGKTPLSLYLAMQYGIRAANYPLTPEDLALGELPSVLRPFKGRLYGLTISSERLHNIRSGRRPGSDYSSKETCNREVNAALRMFNEYGISYLDSGSASVEELAVQILQLTGLSRRV